MGHAAAGGGDATEHAAPLLPRPARACRPLAAAPTPAPAADLGPLFVRRLWRLARRVRAGGPAAALALLSVAEAVIVSRVGTISSLFYRAFVDGDAGAVPHLLLWSAGAYAGTALFFSLKSGLQEGCAWRWRGALAAQLQAAYCASAARHGGSLPHSLLQGIDNPDQRIAQDLPLLTTALADTLAVLVGVPFSIAWYTLLTRQVFGSWAPVAAAYAFFLLGACLQRLAMAPVAAAVFRQEAAEGCYRYQHVRFRAWAPEIALCRSEHVEQQQLEGRLAHVLAAQGRLVLRRTALAASSRLLEYGGLVVNFGCLAAAVFGGAWQAERASPGGVAAKVSAASFYLLTLIYSFTQVLDLASKVSSLAGLTARVSQLLEALEGAGSAQQAARQAQQQQQQQARHGADPGEASPLQLVGDGTTPSHKRYASQAVLLEPPRLVLVSPVYATDGAAALASPGQPPPLQQQQQQQQQQEGQHEQQQEGQCPPLPGGDSAAPAASPGQAADVMQVSVHSLGSDMLLQEVRQAFPDVPRLAPLLAVPTFQFCGAARRAMHQRLRLGQPPTQQLPAEQGRAAAAPPGGGGSAAAAPPACCPECAAAASAPAAAGGAHDSGSSGCCGSSSGHVCSGGDMEGMLLTFLAWQARVCAHISSSGYWCDAIDPRTGTALHGRQGSRYSEVVGAQVLLGYAKHSLPGGLPLISHPDAGTQVYPATLFTSAPLPLLREAMWSATVGAAAAVLAVPPATHAGSPPSSSPGGDAGRNSSSSSSVAMPPQASSTHGGGLLLCTSSLSVSTPAGVPVVRGLTLQLPAGSSLLIRGPSGCGKSTLVACLAGLWPADAGRFSIVQPHASGSGSPAVMFLPQRALAAPGPCSLREQLAYPAAPAAWRCSCSSSDRGDAGSCDARLARPRHARLHAWWADWLACGLARWARPPDGRARTAPLAGGAAGPAPPLQRQLCACCERLLAAVQQAGLGYLLPLLPAGLDSQRDDWAAVLSPGEMQRVALARVLLHRPLLAVLDEATSSLPDEAAVGLYRELRGAGVSCLSVGHGACMAGLHERVLALHGDGAGGWALL